ncbi:MAG: alpha/beta hydrolase [Verrucomicrobiota bacterium]
MKVERDFSCSAFLILHFHNTLFNGSVNWKRILIGTWSWKRPFISLGSIYVLLCIIALTCADRLIFLPPTPSYSETLPGYIKIDSKNAKPVAAIHLKAKPNAPTIIYSHGNAEDIGGYNIDLFETLHDRGFGVIAYDYPGYGLTPGRSTEATTQQAIKSAWDYAIKSGISPSSIVIVGRSIGTGPSVWLASQTKPAGLILIAPFKSAYSVPFKYPIFPSDLFPNYKRIADIHTPLLVIHGEMDEVIPFSHGQAIYENSPASNKLLVPIKNSGHNDLFDNASDQIFDSMTEFIHQLPKA